MSNPYLVQIPFAANGNKNTIQINRQAGQDPEDATYNTGFPPETMIPTEAGGLPPKGLDFNGIFYELSSPIAHYCRGDRIQFDAAFAAAIGGYSKGYVLASDDYQKDYISLIDNNTSNPNANSTNWAVYAGAGSVPTATASKTGTVKLVNSLSSNATDAALTAAQGKVLGDIIGRFSASFNQNGWVKIPFGNLELIIQWGIFTTGSAQSNLNFPLNFPNQLLSISGNLDSNTADVIGIDFDLSNATRTYVKAGAAQVGGSWLAGKKISWLAIGY